jgi:hypothetical protein
MTPRALVESGRSGIGREVFPESAKEIGRERGLQPGLVTVLRYTKVADGGGDVTRTWVPDSKAIRGRLASVSKRMAHQVEEGGRLVEEVTHLVWLDPDVVVDVADRLRIEAEDYAIVAREPSTAGAFLRLEVRRI